MRLLDQLFEVQAAKTPEATAVVNQDQTLSYRQLDQAADALACRLQAEGVGPGALVALLSERSPEMVIGMLAILKAGGAHLPLDPAHPTQRLQLIIDDAKPAVLLLQDQCRAKLPSELQLPIARKIAAELKRKAGNVLKAGINILQPLHKTRKLDGDNADGGLLPLALSVSDTLHRARAKYKPRAYPGRIVLFRAIAPDPRHELAGDLGWTEVAEGGLEIHDIPGNHTTIFERPSERDRMMKSLDEVRPAAQVYLWAKATSEF